MCSRSRRGQETQNHRTVGLAGTSGGCLVQPVLKIGTSLSKTSYTSAYLTSSYNYTNNPITQLQGT